MTSTGTCTDWTLQLIAVGNRIAAALEQIATELERERLQRKRSRNFG